MKISKLISVLTAVLLLGSFFAFPADAAKSNVIYKNDFSAGDSSIDESFDVYRGLLSTAEEKGNKFLRCTQENARVHFAYGPTDVSNVDVSFKLRATTINDKNNSRVEAMFRSPHIPAWETVAYSLQLRTYQSDLIYADRFSDSNERLSLLSSEDFKMKSGLWNNVQISTRGERMVIYVNGVQLFEYSDDKYGIAGGFGFSSSSMSFDVDDIVITKHTGTALPNPTPNEKPEWSGDISEAEEPDIADTGVIRIDLTTLGQEKVAVSNAIHFLNPFELTAYTWIALGIGVVCLAAATVGIILVLKRRKTSATNL